MTALPGTSGERIVDLCNGNHITQKELAKRIGVSAPQMSRIVSGETKTVSSDILIAVANEFKVSTDFILGLTDISVRKSYDISELRLSEKAVRGLVTGAVDLEILNRLLEHKHFPYLTNLIRIYFEDTATSAMLQAVKEELKEKYHDQELPTMDDITNAITDQLGQLTPMDEQSTDLFKQLMISMMKQSNVESDQ